MVQVMGPWRESLICTGGLCLLITLFLYLCLGAQTPGGKHSRAKECGMSLCPDCNSLNLLGSDKSARLCVSAFLVCEINIADCTFPDYPLT